MEILKNIRRYTHMVLTNYQLVLLDNLIYLGIFEELAKEDDDKKRLVWDVIHQLLNENAIVNYWKDELKEDQSESNPGQAMMDEFEWRVLLQAIAEDETLCSMTISHVVDADTDPDRENTNFRAACFPSDDETVIVFRGTHGAYTWNDNGESVIMADSNSQKEVLEYVNILGAELSTRGTNINEYIKNKGLAISLGDR